MRSSSTTHPAGSSGCGAGEARNAETPGRYTHAQAAFFQTRDRVAPMGIRDVVGWARTDRGGKQLPIFAPAPRGGCMRWGLCETGADAEVSQ